MTFRLNSPLQIRALCGLALFMSMHSGIRAQTITAVPNQSVCNNASTSAVNFSGAISGSVYTWTNSLPGIGLAATGTGNISPFTAINTGTSPVVASILVVPYSIGPVSTTQTYNYSGAVTSFTVPADVTTMTITAKGAQGGNVTQDGAAVGGQGSVLTGVYTVVPGHVLRILVGQQPASSTNSGGGGGGTFVWDVTASNALLVAAGGGGGAVSTSFGCACSENGVNAPLTNSGASGSGGLGGAGTAGQGGGAVPGAQYGAYGGGGAGWLSNGVAANTNGNCPQAGSAAATPLNGGAGGGSAGGPWGASVNGNGGFGGGGGAMGFCGGLSGGGGGGGYSGGAGGNHIQSPANHSYAGGGGGSFSAGSVSSSAPTNTGSGQVVFNYFTAGTIYGASTQFSMTVKPTPVGSATPTSTTLCSGQGHSINLSSSLPGSTFSWNVVLYSGSVGAVAPFNGTSAVITNTYSGSASLGYTAVAIYNGCSSPTFSSGITLNPLPTVGSTTTNSVLCRGNSTILTGTGTATSYTWSGGVTDGVAFSPTVTASYTVTGTNGNGCSRSATQLISVNQLPVISVNSGSICAGNTFTMNPSGATTYTFSNGSNVVIPAIGTNTYAITGTDANGCVSASAAISTVTVNTLPVISVNSGSICAGKTFTMNPSGATSYTYSGGSNTVTPAIGTNTYAVTGTDGNGCVSASAAIATVTVNALPVISVNSGSICAGKTFTMNPSGATTYTYSNGSNTVSPAVGTSTYAVTGTDGNACVSASAAIATVTVNTLPVISVNSGSICAGKTFTMNPSGATTYTYSNGSNTVSPGVGTSTYAVTGTDANGCVSASVAISTVTVNTLPVISVNSGSICAGKTFTMSPSGATTYTYSSGTNTVSPAVGTTTFAVTGTNANGCISASPAIATVSVNALPVISVNSGSICAGKTFTMNPTGATTYTYSSGTNTLSPAVGTTTYAVTGTNAIGCVSASAAVATVTVNALPAVTVNSGSICAGSIFTMVPSGATTYTYSSGTSTVSPSALTSYTVTGTNATGCVSPAAIATVTVNALPVISVNSGSICAGGVFAMVPSGATTYTFSNGSNTVSPISTASYSVTGTDLNGCISASAAVSAVTVQSLPVISVNNGSICAGDIFTMTPSGADTYTYSSGSNTVSPTATDSYSVTGTDLNGCVSVPVVSTVTVNILPVVSVSGGSICVGGTFTLVPSGADTYTYSSGSNTVSPTSTDSYSITGTDLNGCVSATAVVTITVNTLPVVSVNSGSICPGQTFTMVPLGADTYTFSSGSNTVSPTTTDSYSITGTDLNGCVSAIAVSTVTVNTVPLVSLSSDHGTLCTGETAILTAGGATGYVWSTSAITTSISVSPATTTIYSVTGTDANGCSASATYTQVVSPCTGIEEASATAAFMAVYPNPSNGVFTVEVSESVTIQVMDVLGKLVLSAELSEGKHQLSMDQQGNGFYFLNVTGKDHRETFRLIKQ